MLFGASVRLLFQSVAATHLAIRSNVDISTGVGAAKTDGVTYIRVAHEFLPQVSHAF